MTRQNDIPISLDVLARLPWGACVVDQAWKVHAWNDVLAKWTGVAANEAVGTILAQRFPHLLGPPYRERIAQVFRTGQPTLFSAALHKQFLPTRETPHGEGPAAIQKTRVQPFGKDGRQVLILIEDATAQYRQMQELRLERTRLKTAMHEVVESQRRQAHMAADLELKNHKLREANQNVESANRAKSEFLANMSHELRTPMNSIMGFTKRLLKRLGSGLAEQDRDALVTVDRNAKHLLRLINDILDISKIEAGRTELDTADVNVAGVLREVADQMMALTDGRPVELVVDVPEEEVVIRADRLKLLQIVTNLTANALKFTSRGSVRFSVRWIDDERLGRATQIRVVDTGVGIKQQDIERLFKKFSQVDDNSTRQVTGTGLGLCIAAKYVEMHGGRIDVESSYGQGSTFSVVLPLSAETVDVCNIHHEQEYYHGKSTRR